MKNIKKAIITFIITIVVFSYLRWLIGLPYWISAILSMLILFPPTFYYFVQILLLSSTIISIGIHIYTTIFAFIAIWWKGILTLVLPGIAEVYWFIVEASRNSIAQSIYCRILLAYLLLILIRFVSPLLIKHFLKNDEDTVSVNKADIEK